MTLPSGSASNILEGITVFSTSLIDLDQLTIGAFTTIHPRMSIPTIPYLLPHNIRGGNWH